jgi:hypothetical protein
MRDGRRTFETVVSTRRLATLFAAVLLAPVGCGGGADSGDVRGSGAGLLLIEQVQAGAALYIEGSVSYVRVETQQGDTVLEERLPARDRPSVSVRLDPGDYRLASWQRPCDGNCSVLDPATDRCERSVTIGSSQELHAIIRLSPGEGCSIALAS